jgi:hypothetical protein
MMGCSDEKVYNLAMIINERKVQGARHAEVTRHLPAFRLVKK